jgi:hypothetical protein
VSVQPASVSRSPTWSGRTSPHMRSRHLELMSACRFVAGVRWEPIQSRSCPEDRGVPEDAAARRRARPGGAARSFG